MDPILEMQKLIKQLKEVIEDLTNKSSKYDLMVAENKSLREEVKQVIIMKDFWQGEYKRLK